MDTTVLRVERSDDATVLYVTIRRRTTVSGEEFVKDETLVVTDEAAIARLAAFAPEALAAKAARSRAPESTAA